MNRRTLLTRVVGLFSVVGIAGFSFPFLRSLMPSFDNEVVMDVDLSGLNVGEVKMVRWLGRNVLVVRRDPATLDNPGIAPERLQDPGSASAQQPAFARNEYRARKVDHLVVFANCTHLGCEVMLNDTSDFTGFRCPCHRSEFDASGRVIAGSAAKLNLEVPNYHYVARETIRLKKVSDPDKNKNERENV